MALVRSLGGDDVIDHHSTRFEDMLRDIDVVLDLIGGETRERSRRVLRKGGVLVTLVSPIPPDVVEQHGVRGPAHAKRSSTVLQATLQANRASGGCIAARSRTDDAPLPGERAAWVEELIPGGNSPSRSGAVPSRQGIYRQEWWVVRGRFPPCTRAGPILRVSGQLAEASYPRAERSSEEMDSRDPARPRRNDRKTVLAPTSWRWSHLLLHADSSIIDR